MKTYQMTSDEADRYDTEHGWIDVRRKAKQVALEHDEMTEVIDPDGNVVDTVYPSSIET